MWFWRAVVVLTTLGAASRGEESLVCSYECPKGSTAAVLCPQSFNDCNCITNFVRTEKGCVCDYACPSHSFVTAFSSGLECARNFGECTCESGFHREGDGCIACDFTCPQNFTQASEYQCPKSLEDCHCGKGHYRTAPDTCLECYQCPRFSTPRDDVSCPRGFEDCICHESSHRDEAQELCTCSFACPEGRAWTMPNFACPIDFRNCLCRSNLLRTEDDCLCMFSCPENSESAIYCPRNNADCKCKANYRKFGEDCVFCAFQCPQNSSPTNPGNCTSTLEDCQCSSGYVKEGDRCVLSWGDSETILFSLLFGVCALFSGGAALAARITQRDFLVFIPFFFALLDISTDVLFAIDLFNEGGGAYGIAAFVVIFITLCVNVFLAQRLIQKFRASASPLLSDSFSLWERRPGSKSVLALYSVMSAFTVEALNISSSRAFSNKFFQVPIPAHLQSLALGYSVINNIVEDIPQLLIVILSRKYLGIPWGLYSVLSVSVTVFSLLFSVVFRTTALMAQHAGWVASGEYSRDADEYEDDRVEDNEDDIQEQVDMQKEIMEQERQTENVVNNEKQPDDGFKIKYIPPKRTSDSSSNGGDGTDQEHKRNSFLHFI